MPAAVVRARQMVEEAEAEARRMRRETEDFCDQKLASFEIVLERTLKTVGAGRDKLQAMPMLRGEAEEDDYRRDRERIESRGESEVARLRDTSPKESSR